MNNNFVSTESIRNQLNAFSPFGKYINISVNNDETTKKLTVVFEGVKKVKDIRIISRFKMNYENILTDLNISTGSKFSEDLLNSYGEKIRKYFEQSAYKELTIAAKTIFEGDDVVFEYTINSNKKLFLKEVIIDSDNLTKNTYEPFFYELYSLEFEPLIIKLKSDLIYKDLFSSGYFKAKITHLNDEVLSDSKSIISKIKIDTGPKVIVSITGQQRFTMQEVRGKIFERIKLDSGEFNQDSISELIKDIYEKVGLYGSTVVIKSEKTKNLKGVPFTLIHVKIKEGKKLRVRQITYKGINTVDQNEVEEIFTKNATTLAQSQFYDKEFYENFSDLLKKMYYSKGFVQIEVSKPIINYFNDNSVSIEYYVNERDAFKVSAIDFGLIPEEVKLILNKGLANKVDHSINITELENDMQKIIANLQEAGFYFAAIKNSNSNNLLDYEKSSMTVKIKPQIELGSKICFNELIIAGNRVTKNRVIEREFEFSKGQVITPSQLTALSQKLSNLGLFSSLRVSPYVIYEDQEEKVTCTKTNILVQVKEKDFGAGEIAPGYRTDLGWKLSTGISYNNIQGMNRQITLGAQANLRTSLTGFDVRRKSENKRMIESTFKISVVEPYVLYNTFKTQVELETQASYQRKRFSGFDANIYRVSPQLSKSFDKFVTSVRYQLEGIEQFDATESKDNNDFVIGSITPAITLDLRNDPINTKKGAYFNLSSEWANKYFGSMNKNDLEINYLKLISRNRFYYSLGDITFAMSLSGGYQKNFANNLYINSSGNNETNSNGELRTKGYIPSIKLFRLEGYEEVRGFEDSEINVVESGENISKVVVQDSLYFMNFKLEPRYNLTEQLQIGVFFDAGRLYLNSFSPLDMRTSVGAGFKFLTPVGSLDFDYGVKLDRKTNKSGAQESFGRFHLSIGFF